MPSQNPRLLLRHPLVRLLLARAHSPRRQPWQYTRWEAQHPTSSATNRIRAKACSPDQWTPFPRPLFCQLASLRLRPTTERQLPTKRPQTPPIRRRRRRRTSQKLASLSPDRHQPRNQRPPLRPKRHQAAMKLAPPRRRQRPFRPSSPTRPAPIRQRPRHHPLSRTRPSQLPQPSRHRQSPQPFRWQPERPLQP